MNVAWASYKIWAKICVKCKNVCIQFICICLSQSSLIVPNSSNIFQTFSHIKLGTDTYINYDYFDSKFAVYIF